MLLQCWGINKKPLQGAFMGKLFLIALLGIIVSSCASLHSTMERDQKKYKVFVVNKKPTKCIYVSQVSGVGKESFEGNTRYTIPLAMIDIKRKTAGAGANVLYIQEAYSHDNTYVVKGECYKCRTKKIVRRRRAPRRQYSNFNAKVY